MLLTSCSNKDGFFYIEEVHKNGNRYLSLIHSDLKCSNINGALDRIDSWAYLQYNGFCNECMTSKEITNVESWIKRDKYNKESLDAFLAMVKISRKYYNGEDTIPDNRFIKALMIDNPENISKVYDEYRDGRGILKGWWDDSKKLFKMDKEAFLVRIKRWAEYYLNDDFSLVTSEDHEKDLDYIDIDDEEDE